MRHRKLLPFLFLAGTASMLPAASIVYVGAASGTEVSKWRTDSVAKTYDFDGDGVYGSFGALNWQEAAVGGESVGSGSFGFAIVPGSAGAQYSRAEYDDIDSLTVTNSMTDAGITLNKFTFEFTGVDADYTDKVFRLGVMQGVLGSAEVAKDFDKNLSVTEVDGAGVAVSGGGASGLVSVRGGAADTINHIDMLFFDISNIEAGDRFEVLAPNSGDANAVSGYNSAFSLDYMDVSSVPEPNTSLLIALSSVCLIFRRKPSH